MIKRSILCLVLAFVLCSCNTTYVQVEQNNRNKKPNDKQCSIDPSTLFNRLSRSVGPAQSAAALESSIKNFLQQNNDIWKNSPAACYLNDVIEVGVPVRGSKPLNMRVFYQFWLYKSNFSGLRFVCVSVNGLTNRRHPTSPFSQHRFNPVCEIRTLNTP